MDLLQHRCGSLRPGQTMMGRPFPAQCLRMPAHACTCLTLNAPQGHRDQGQLLLHRRVWCRRRPQPLPADSEEHRAPSVSAQPGGAWHAEQAMRHAHAILQSSGGSGKEAACSAGRAQAAARPSGHAASGGALSAERSQRIAPGECRRFTNHPHELQRQRCTPCPALHLASHAPVLQRRRLLQQPY